MRKPTFSQKLIIPLAIVVIGLVFFQLFFTSHLIQDYSRSKIKSTLHSDVSILRYWLDQYYPNLQSRRLQEALETYRSLMPNTQITVVDMGGDVLADSMHNPETIGNIANRPEIQSALRGKTGKDRRYSSLIGHRAIYVAVPLKKDQTVRGVIRVARPDNAFADFYESFGMKLLLSLSISGLLAVVIVIFIAGHFARPLHEIRTDTEKLAEGKLKTRLPSFNTRDLDNLAQNLNQMAAHLEDRIQTEKQQRNEVEAVLASMAEGVLAVDTEERVDRINSAACAILGVTKDYVQGKTLQVSIRNAELQSIVYKALHSQEQVKGEIALYEEQPKYIEVKSAVIRNAAGSKIGAVAVLNDVTQMRRLENMRKDFVANVSHEIRTPVTSIQGFVETLLDGALNNEKDARRFLEIIRHHTERLNALIEDLLTISRLERSEAQESLKFEDHDLKSKLNSAIQACRKKADDKSIDILLDCPDDVRVKINPTLFEQAIVNMLDNAINYSEKNSSIEVKAEVSDTEITVSVKDPGSGIASEHLSRIFERFYRIDKGRSREQGGTGLGLAILKHVAQIHDGRVSVDSKLNEGSTFRIHLPVKCMDKPQYPG